MMPGMFCNIYLNEEDVGIKYFMIQTTTLYIKKE